MRSALENQMKTLEEVKEPYDKFYEAELKQTIEGKIKEVDIQLGRINS